MVFMKCDSDISDEILMHKYETSLEIQKCNNNLNTYFSAGITIFRY